MADALCTQCHLPRGTIARPNPADLLCSDCSAIAATSYHAAVPDHDPYRGIFSQFGQQGGGGGGSGPSIFGSGGGGGGPSIFGSGGGGGGGSGGVNGHRSAHHFNGSGGQVFYRVTGFTISGNIPDHDTGVSLHDAHNNDDRPANARFSPIVTEPVSVRPRLVSPAQRRALNLDSASSWAPLNSPTLVTAAGTVDTVRPWAPLSSPALVSIAKAEADRRGAARESVLASSASGSSLHSRVMNADRDPRPHFLYRDFDQGDQGYSRYPWT
jgi:hypothetical protein